MPSIASKVLDKYNGVTTPADTKLGGPDAPYRQDKNILTESQRAFREQLKSNLQTGIWEVGFTKVDGTPAVMECTLDKQYLPVSTEPHRPISVPRVFPEHTLRVYAVDRQGWRSFRIDSVQTFKQK